LLNAAVLNFEMKEWAHALRYAERALALQGDHPEAQLVAGRVHYELGNFKAAAEMLADTAAKAPEAIDIQLAYGWSLLRLHEYAGAIAAFDHAIHHAPTVLEGWAGLSQVYLAQGRLDAAIPALQKCIDIEPGQLEAYVILAGALQDNQQLDEAAGVIDAAIQRFGPEPAIIERAGLLQFARKSYDKAETYFQQALSDDPSNAGIHEHLGYSYLMQRDFVHASKTFQRVWRLKPLAWSSLFNLTMCYAMWAYHLLRYGNLGISVSMKGIKLTAGRSRSGQLLDAGQDHFRAGDYAKAAMVFRKVKDNDPNFEVASIWLATSKMKLNELDEAIGVCNHGLSRSPASAQLLALLGTICLAQGKVRNAIKILNRALDLDPDLGPAWLTLGHACNKDEAFSDAYNAFRKALELGVEDPYLFRHLGDAAMAMDNRTAAIEAYQGALAHNPQDLVSCQRLIECYFLAKQYDPAISYANHAISIDAKCYAAYTWLGRIYRQLKAYTAAKEAFEKAIAIKPTMAYLYRQLGSLHEVLFEGYEAIEAYQAALKIDGEDQEAERGLARAKKLMGKR
jgi:tetratricopeptide (TPR) repeat protein